MAQTDWSPAHSRNNSQTVLAVWESGPVQRPAPPWVARLAACRRAKLRADVLAGRAGSGMAWRHPIAYQRGT
jgi:hypothetical protein